MNRGTYPVEQRRDILQRYDSLVAEGVTQLKAAEQLKVGINSIRRWAQRLEPVEGISVILNCVRCSAQPSVPPREPYTYLLGLYLGDGHISRVGRTHRLRVYCADAYPGLIESCAASMRACLPNPVSFAPLVGCTAVGAYSRHWLCLFPQHGPGMKHTRRIELEAWQRELVEADPRPFLRGLIHSDGCRVTNRVTVRGKRYAYPRYFFSNESADIRGLFCWACEQLGVRWRQNNGHSINVARREDVARLDEFIGPKR